MMENDNKEADRREAFDRHTPAGRETASSEAQAQILAAEKAAYVQPSPPRRLGGRIILSLQRLYDKVLAGRLVQLQEQVIDQDRELSAFARDTAELSAQLAQMNRRLKDFEERLADLEQRTEPPENP